MDSPPRETASPDGYSEAEFVRILRMAAELQDRTAGDASPHSLTLAQIQEIAGEVGIGPEHVAAAAAMVATASSEQWRTWLAAPVQGELSRALPGGVSQAMWQEIAGIIRQAAGTPGQHSYVPGDLEWVHADEAGRVRVRVRDAGGQAHVHISADHRQGAVMYLTLTPVLGTCAAMLPVVLLGWGESAESWLLLTGGAGTGLAVGWAYVKAIGARWQRRMRGVLHAITERTAAEHAGEIEPARGGVDDGRVLRAPRSDG